MIHTEEDDEFERILRENKLKGQAYDFNPQRIWTGLTDEEVESLQRLAIDPVDANGWGLLNRERFARLIEIKLKEKNT